VGVSDLSHDCQSKSGSVWVCRIPRLEDLVAFVSGNPRPVVGHVEPGFHLPNCDAHIFAAVFDRVPKQILEQFAESALIGLNRW
jgi:hypothetical protein